MMMTEEESDFVIKLETAASIFLELLLSSKQYNTDLSVIKYVCDIVKFMRRETDVGLQFSAKDISISDKSTQTADKLLESTAVCVEIDDVNDTLQMSCEAIKEQDDLNQDADNTYRETEQIHDSTPLGTSDMIQNKTKQFPCNTCGQVFRTTKARNGHMKGHKGKKQLVFNCELCSKIFTHPKNLQLHKTNWHSEEMNERWNLSGKLCKTNGCKQGDNNEGFACTVCPKVLSTVRARNSHIRTHTPKVKAKRDKNDKFQCRICQKVLLTRQALSGHMKKHKRQPEQPERKSVVSEEFTCPICHMVLLTRNARYAHMRKHTPQSERKQFTCGICYKIHATKNARNAHMRKHRPQAERKRVHVGNYTCSICQKVYSTTNALNGHMGIHRPRKRTGRDDQTAAVSDNKETGAETEPYGMDAKQTNEITTQPKQLGHEKGDFKCDICQRVYKTIQARNGHMSKHRNLSKSAREQNLSKSACEQDLSKSAKLAKDSNMHRYEKCEVCGLSYFDMSMLNEHKMKHTSQEEETSPSTQRNFDRYKCELCGKVYVHESRLSEHMAIHKMGRDLYCQQCSKRFVKTRDHLMHQRVHRKRPNRTKEYQCHICPIISRSLTASYIHMKSHQIDRPFVCTTCDKTFTRLYQLEKHKQKHTGRVDKKSHYNCEVCGKVYKFKANLKVHMKVHPDGLEHLCEFCNKKFDIVAELHRHIVTHTTEKMYMCDICNSCYTRQSMLDRHRRGHAGEYHELCEECGMCLKDTKFLKRHMWTVHNKKISSQKNVASTMTVPTHASIPATADTNILPCPPPLIKVNYSEATHVFMTPDVKPEVMTLQQMGRPVLHHMDRPVLHHMDRQVLQHMDRPVIHQMDRPVIHQMDRTGLQQMDRTILQHMDRPVLQHMDRPVIHQMDRTGLQQMDRTILQQMDRPILHQMDRTGLQQMDIPVLHQTEHGEAQDIQIWFG